MREARDQKKTDKMVKSTQIARLDGICPSALSAISILWTARLINISTGLMLAASVDNEHVCRPLFHKSKYELCH